LLQEWYRNIVIEIKIYKSKFWIFARGMICNWLTEFTKNWWKNIYPISNQYTVKSVCIKYGYNQNLTVTKLNSKFPTQNTVARWNEISTNLISRSKWSLLCNEIWQYTHIALTLYWLMKYQQSQLSAYRFFSK